MMVFRNLIYLLLALNGLLLGCSKSGSESTEPVFPEVSAPYKAYQDSIRSVYKDQINDIDKYNFVYVQDLIDGDAKQSLIAYNSDGGILFCFIDSQGKILRKTILNGHKTKLNGFIAVRPFQNKSISKNNEIFLGLSLFEGGSYEAKEIYVVLPKEDSFVYTLLDNSSQEYTLMKIYNEGDETFCIEAKGPNFKIFDKKNPSFLYSVGAFEREYNYSYSFQKNKSIIQYTKDVSYLRDQQYTGFRIASISHDLHLREDLPYEKYGHKIFWEKSFKTGDNWTPQRDEKREETTTFEESETTVTYIYKMSGWKYNDKKQLVAVNEEKRATLDKATGEEI